MEIENQPELQTLMGNGVETERRKGSTKIPLDKSNSRMLRRSISNYLSQQTQIQDEIEELERQIEKLKQYIGEMELVQCITDNHMYDMEEYMSSYDNTANKIRSLLKIIEPKTDFSRSSLTLERYSTMQTFGGNNTTLRNSTGTSQHFSLSLLFYTTNQAYKELLDRYNSLLESRNACQLNEVISHEDEIGEATAKTPFFQRGTTIDAAKLRLKHVSLESDIKNRENQIREWHRGLSSTFQSRYTSLTPPSSANSVKSFDVEEGLATPTFTDSVFEKFNPPRSPTAYQNKMLLKEEESKIDFKKCIISYIVVIILTAVILTTVGMMIYFLVYKPYSEQSSHVTANNQSATSNADDNQDTNNKTDTKTATISLELNFTETELITMSGEDDYTTKNNYQTTESTQRAPADTTEEVKTSSLFNILANNTDNTTTAEAVPLPLPSNVTDNSDSVPEITTTNPINDITTTIPDFNTTRQQVKKQKNESILVEDTDLEEVLPNNITLSSSEDSNMTEYTSTQAEVNTTLPSLNTDENKISNTTESDDIVELDLADSLLSDTNSTVSDLILGQKESTTTELMEDLPGTTTLDTTTMIIDDQSNSTIKS